MVVDSTKASVLHHGKPASLSGEHPAKLLAIYKPYRSSRSQFLGSFREGGGCYHPGFIRPVVVHPGKGLLNGDITYRPGIAFKLDGGVVPVVAEDRSVSQWIEAALRRKLELEKPEGNGEEEFRLPPEGVKPQGSKKPPKLRGTTTMAEVVIEDRR